jgi:hypothetical protein
MVMPSAVALGIGRSVPTMGAPVRRREGIEVAAEIGQQDVFAEVFQGQAGVTRQPVADDLVLVLHPFPSPILTSKPAIPCRKSGLAGRLP